jgi:hypothetical protein
MAQVTKERLDEMQDPEQTISRAMKEYMHILKNAIFAATNN